MINALVIFSVALVYRLRGWGGFLYGTFSRRLFWSASAGASCLLLGADVYTSIVAAIGAFAGMWIEHSHCYTVNNLQEAVSLGAIGSARMLLMLWWHPSCSYAALASFVLTPLMYWAGCKIARYFKKDEMWFAEPLCGAMIGGILTFTL